MPCLLTDRRLILMKNAPIDKETTEKKTAARIHPASEHLSSKAIRKVSDKKSQWQSFKKNIGRWPSTPDIKIIARTHKAFKRFRRDNFAF